jgi:KaiC/GvpD/RAD55 family RecA-like ATPase
MYFVDKIKRMVKENGFMSVMIVGRQGVGKTTYAMHTLYHYYGDWDKVLESMTFDPIELLRKRSFLKEGYQVYQSVQCITPTSLL